MQAHGSLMLPPRTSPGPNQACYRMHSDLCRQLAPPCQHSRKLRSTLPGTGLHQPPSLQQLTSPHGSSNGSSSRRSTMQCSTIIPTQVQQAAGINRRSSCHQQGHHHSLLHRSMQEGRCRASLAACTSSPKAPQQHQQCNRQAAPSTSGASNSSNLATPHRKPGSSHSSMHSRTRCQHSHTNQHGKVHQPAQQGRHISSIKPAAVGLMYQVLQVQLPGRDLLHQS